MGVRHGGDGVDLEVLVRSNVGGGLDGAPVGEGWLGIVEPLVSNSLQDVGIDVGNSLGDLTSWDSSSDVVHLHSDLLVQTLNGLVGEHVIVHGSSSSDDLDLIEVMGIDGWEMDSTVVHLSGEDLISEEVVSEKTSIRVGEVVALGSGHVWQVSHHGVHRVVLLVDIIEVLSVLVDSVGAEHVLEESKGVEVLILGGRGIVEHSDVGVVHLIISDHEQAWHIDWLLGVHGIDRGVLGQGVEELLGSINDLLVGDVTSGDDGDVISIVVGGVEVSDVIERDGLGEISVSLDWLSEHVLSKGVEMNVLESGLLKPVVVVLMLLSYFLLAEFKLGRVEGLVAKHVSEHGHGFGGISGEALEAIASPLSVGLSRVSGSHVLDILRDLGSGSGGSASGGHFLEEVRSSCGLEGLVSRSGSDVDSDAIRLLMGK